MDGCMEVVMQGLRAQSDSFLAAMWLECYVLLQYFERARATKEGVWSHVSMEPHNRTSTVHRFCLRKTEVFLCFWGRIDNHSCMEVAMQLSLIHI